MADILTLCTLSVNLSVSVVVAVVETCPAPSLMALCSTCRLKGQRSTAPEADSHQQKLCVYGHQATTSLSPVGGGRSGGYLIGHGRQYITTVCFLNTVSKIDSINLFWSLIFYLRFQEKHRIHLVLFQKKKSWLKKDKTSRLNVYW